MVSDNWSQLHGTVLVVVSSFVFALVALVVKADPLPVFIAAELRFLVGWVLSIACMLLFRNSKGLHWFGQREVRKCLLLKSTLAYGFTTLWWSALDSAPIGDCIAIVYTSPLLTLMLSWVLLGEQLPREFPVQLLLVSIGTALVIDPPFIHATTHNNNYTNAFLALGAAAIIPVVTRKASDCSWMEVEHVSACLSAVALGPSGIFGSYLMFGSIPDMNPVTTGQIGLVFAAGVGSFVGVAMQTKGYQLAEVGKASMFRYLEVPFGYLLQYVGTSSPVEKHAVIGAVLIILSCLLGFRSLGGDGNKGLDSGNSEHDQLVLQEEAPQVPDLDVYKGHQANQKQVLLQGST